MKMGRRFRQVTALSCQVRQTGEGYPERVSIPNRPRQRGSFLPQRAGHGEVAVVLHDVAQLAQGKGEPRTIAYLLCERDAPLQRLPRRLIFAVDALGGAL